MGKRPACVSSIALAVAVAAATAGGCAKKAGPPVSQLVVEGQVFWTDRAPADGVVVQGLRERGGSPCRTLTHDGGKFQLSCPGVPSVRLIAVPEDAGGGRTVEVFPEPKVYEARPAPYRGVELFAARPR